MAATISDIADEVAAERNLNARNEYVAQRRQMQDEIDALDDDDPRFNELMKRIGLLEQERTASRTNASDQLVVRAALYGGDFRKAAEDLKQNPQLIQPVQEADPDFFEHGIDASLVELVKNCPIKCAEELFGPIIFPTE